MRATPCGIYSENLVGTQFLRTHSADRSQMAAGLLATEAGGQASPSVNWLLTSGRGSEATALHLESGGLDTGAVAQKPDGAAARGPVSSPPRPGRLPGVSAGPDLCLSRQPTGV